MKSEYHGIYAALVTPYTSEGKVDYRELQKLDDHFPYGKKRVYEYQVGNLCQSL